MTASARWRRGVTTGADAGARGAPSVTSGWSLVIATVDASQGEGAGQQVSEVALTAPAPSMRSQAVENIPLV